MGRLVSLPNGQSATLRPVEEVSERLRRPIVRALRRVTPAVLEAAVSAANLPDGPAKLEAAMQATRIASEEDTDAMNEANDLGVVALVESWSFPQEITLQGVLDLPAKAYDKLRETVAPLVNDLFVDASPNPEPTSPFGSSNGSSTPSTAASLTASLTSGEPTASSSSESP